MLLQGKLATEPGILYIWLAPSAYLQRKGNHDDQYNKDRQSSTIHPAPEFQKLSSDHPHNLQKSITISFDRLADS